MTKLIARLSLFINNVMFFIAIILAVIFAGYGYDAYLSGKSTDALLLTVMAPLMVIVVATLLCSMIALLGAIWLSIEEGNEQAAFQPTKPNQRIEPKMSS